MMVSVSDDMISLVGLRSLSLSLSVVYYLPALYYFALNNKYMHILINLLFILSTVDPKVPKIGKSSMC